jgi:hypothetical protein
MLRALCQWWRGYVAAIPKTDVVDSIPESQWGREDLLPSVSKAKRESFRKLLSLVCAHLPAHEAEALVVEGVARFIRADEPDLAFYEALLHNENPSQNRGFIGCDWKAVEEVQWQADQLCKAHGAVGRWAAPAGDLNYTLRNLDEWLRDQGVSLLCVWPGDSVVAFALPSEQVESAIALGKRLKLKILKPGEA